MKRTVTFQGFTDAFRAQGRMEQFTYQGLQVLFDALEELEADTGEEMELDVIALCCDFYESDWEDVADNYSIDLTGCEDDAERHEKVKEFLEENTHLCGIASGSGNFVYQAF